MVSKFISNKNLKIDLKNYKNIDYEKTNSQVSVSTNCQSPLNINSHYIKSPVKKIPMRFQTNENSS